MATNSGFIYTEQDVAAAYANGVISAAYGDTVRRGPAVLLDDVLALIADRDRETRSLIAKGALDGLAVALVAKYGPPLSHDGRVTVTVGIDPACGCPQKRYRFECACGAVSPWGTKAEGQAEHDAHRAYVADPSSGVPSDHAPMGQGGKPAG